MPAERHLRSRQAGNEALIGGRNQPSTPPRRLPQPGNLPTPPSSRAGRLGLSSARRQLNDSARKRTVSPVPFSLQKAKKSRDRLSQGKQSRTQKQAQGLAPEEGRGVVEDKPEEYVKIHADKLGWDHNPLQPDAEDCEEDHYLDGLRLPPVGTSLQEIIAYLSGRDVYKSDDWPVRAKFIGRYLDFLEEASPLKGDGRTTAGRHVDDAGRLLPLIAPPPKTYQPPVYGLNTRMLILETRRLLRVQALFETHQYNTIKQATVLRSSGALPTIYPRHLRVSSLLLLGVGKSQIDIRVPTAASGQQDALKAKKALAAEGGADDIYRIRRHYPHATNYCQQMATDDGRLVGQPVQPDEPIDIVIQRARREVAAAEAGGQNLAYQENTEFYESVYARRGWVLNSRDGSSATVQVVRRLPDGTVLGQDAASYARERGSRRAALQLALAEFSSAENTAASMGSPWRRVTLPVPARSISKHVEAAGNCWRWATKTMAGTSATIAPVLEPDPWQAIMDESRKGIDDGRKLSIVSKQTHPYTAYMAEYRRHRFRWMEKARKVAESENRDNLNWTMLPRFPDAYCLGYSSSKGHPRQPLPRPMEQDRKMLVLLRSIVRLLKRALEVAPRPLLRDVRKYTTQGLRGLAAPDEALQLRDTYDWQTKTVVGTGGRKRIRVARAISEAEARWLKFLMTGSTNSRMVLPLPAGADLREDLEKAGDLEQEKEDDSDGQDGQVLYECFALRLQGLMDDLSDTRLFQAVDTEVTIKALVDTINRDGSSPSTGWQGMTALLEVKEVDQQRLRFSYSDARFFCDRLSKAGRCRFSTYKYGSGAGNHGGGIVQRPKLSLHPEHRIWAEDKAPLESQDEPSWLARQPPEANEHDVDVAIGAPRRTLEVDSSWAKTVASGRAKKPLRTEVHDFFCALAFRFGRTLRQLQTVERGKWEDAAWKSAGSDSHAPGSVATERSRKNRAKDSMSTWQRQYENLARHNKTDCRLIDIVRGADPTAVASLGSMAAEDVRRFVRHKLLVEAERSLTPLPTANAPRPTGSLWDWALPEVCGTAPQFFSIDRWPQHVQTPDVERYWARQNAVLDPEMIWDPASEDPAPVKYMWQPSSSGAAFGFHKETEQVGPVAFLHGETKLQQQMVINDITERVATALAAADGSGIWDRLSARVPFLRWRQGVDSALATIEDVVVKDTPLPIVAGSSIPHSVPE